MSLRGFVELNYCLLSWLQKGTGVYMHAHQRISPIEHACMHGYFEV